MPKVWSSRFRQGRTRVRRGSAARVALVVLMGGVLAGCNGTTPPTEPTEPPTSTQVVDPYAAQNRTPDPGAVGIGLTKMSLAHTSSADQLTLEFTGSAIPGWAVHYVNEPLQNSTQKIFPIAGRTFIEVLVREAANPFVSGATPYAGSETLTDPNMGAIGEVKYAGAGRGVTQVFIGLTTPQVGLRVNGFDNPTRVVVEIDHR